MLLTPKRTRFYRTNVFKETFGLNPISCIALSRCFNPTSQSQSNTIIVAIFIATGNGNENIIFNKEALYSSQVKNEANKLLEKGFLIKNKNISGKRKDVKS